MKKLIVLTSIFAAALGAGCGEPEEPSKPSDPTLDAAGPPKFGTGESTQAQGAPSAASSEFK